MIYIYIADIRNLMKYSTSFFLNLCHFLDAQVSCLNLILLEILRIVIAFCRWSFFGRNIWSIMEGVAKFFIKFCLTFWWSCVGKFYWNQIVNDIAMYFYYRVTLFVILEINFNILFDYPTRLEFYLIIRLGISFIPFFDQNLI